MNDMDALGIAAARSSPQQPSVVRIDETSDLWWKNAIVYCVDVKTFLDFDGDGCGDLQGLIHRIDYLAGIGVTCLWLMPFYPSPRRDDGYDITDFYSVDPRLGSLGDFTQLVRTARDRGIRVIIDLVGNHTSDLHPWFQAARSDPRSPFRDWYVWRDQPEDLTEVVFPGHEDSAWTYDEEAGQYYMHHFMRHQPDLNLTNPAVRDELIKVMAFWVSLGVSGFRMDAVPFLLDERDHAHELLRAMRAFMGRRFGEGILLGEVNLPASDQREFFGKHGDELNLQFNFRLNQAMYLAFARRDATPLENVVESMPRIPPDAAWANFVRNHDELSLDKLTEEEREEVFDAFGGEPEMRLFGRGLRRRLPTMVGGDERRIRLAYSLVFSLPGAPVLFYGEEIGMGENPEVPGRLAVRPPMQWSGDEEAGFAPPGTGELVRPIVEDEKFGPEAVNVADQRRDRNSMLNWMERLIRRRRECPEIGWGRPSCVPCDDGVFAHRCDWRNVPFVAVHNLTDERREVSLELDDLEKDDVVISLLDNESPTPVNGAHVKVALDPYEGRWLRVRHAGQRVLP
ncbi:MAG: alpha-amylase family protein [Thermoleophilaceae bacterium]